MMFQCGVALSVAAAVGGIRVDVADRTTPPEATSISTEARPVDYIPLVRFSAEKRGLYVVVDRSNARFSVAECVKVAAKGSANSCALLADSWPATSRPSTEAFDRAFNDAARAHDELAGAQWRLGGSLANLGWSGFVGIGTGVLFAAPLGVGAGIALGLPFSTFIFAGYEIRDHWRRAHTSIDVDLVRFNQRPDGSVGLSAVAERRPVSREQYLAIKQSLVTALATRPILQRN